MPTAGLPLSARKSSNRWQGRMLIPISWRKMSKTIHWKSIATVISFIRSKVWQPRFRWSGIIPSPKVAVIPTSPSWRVARPTWSSARARNRTISLNCLSKQWKVWIWPLTKRTWPLLWKRFQPNILVWHWIRWAMAYGKSKSPQNTV